MPVVGNALTAPAVFDGFARVLPFGLLRCDAFKTCSQRRERRWP